MVGFLIEKGARLLQKDVAPLHRAAERGHANVARIILQSQQGNYKGDCPNVVKHPAHLSGALDRHGETPLHKAASNGHANVVEVLLENAPTAKDVWLRAKVRRVVDDVMYEKNAYHLAVAHGQLAVVRLLHTQTDLPSVREDAYNEVVLSPFDMAAEGNHKSTAMYLVEENMRRGKDAFDLSHALETATKNGHEEMVQIFLDSQTGMVLLGIVILAAATRHGMILEKLINAHRSEGFAVYDETTKLLLFRAWERTQKKGQKEAAALLKDLCQREAIVQEAKRRHAID